MSRRAVIGVAGTRRAAGGFSRARRAAPGRCGRPATRCRCARRGWSGAAPGWAGPHAAAPRAAGARVVHRLILPARQGGVELLEMPGTPLSRELRVDPRIHPPERVGVDLLLGGKAALGARLGWRAAAGRGRLAARRPPPVAQQVARPVAPRPQPARQLGRLLPGEGCRAAGNGCAGSVPSRPPPAGGVRTHRRRSWLAPPGRGAATREAGPLPVPWLRGRAGLPAAPTPPYSAGRARMATAPPLPVGRHRRPRRAEHGRSVLALSRASRSAA